MNSFAYMVISAKGKRNVANAATYFRQGHFLFYFSRGFNKVNSVIVMLFYTCCYGKNVRVKDDVLRIITNLLSQYFIRSFANLYFSLFGICLAFFVKSHYYDRSAIT